MQGRLPCVGNMWPLKKFLDHVFSTRATPGLLLLKYRRTWGIVKIVDGQKAQKIQILICI